MPKQTLHIFRAGRQTTAAGDEIEFSAADLEACAKAYDPALHTAPICVGHPKTNAPAYGVIKGLQVSKGDLVAEHDHVEPQFAELVRQKRFISVSAAFYPPNAKANPVPGVYYLRHVGFLGAEPPALKGLRPPEFAEAEEDDFIAFAEIEFSDPAFGYLARMFRGLRDHFIETLGLEKADQVLPDWNIASIEELGRERDNPAITDSLGTAFREANPTHKQEPADMEPTPREKELQAQLDTANATITADKKAKAKAASDQRVAEATEFAESLITANQLLPRDKALVVSVLDALGGDAPVEFGEGDDKKPAATALRELLQKLPKHALNGKHLAVKGATGTDLTDPHAIAAAAVEFQEAQSAKGITVSTAEAVATVSASQG